MPVLNCSFRSFGRSEAGVLRTFLANVVFDLRFRLENVPFGRALPVKNKNALP